MPCFYSGLHRLVGVQPIQVIHWHTQQLTICKGSGWHSSRIHYHIVNAQLHECNSFHPIINPLVNKSMYNIFDSMVLTFHLIISLQMVSTTKQSLHSEHGPQGMPEWCSKTNVTIMNQPFRNIIVLYPICKEQFSTSGADKWFSSNQVGTMRVSLPRLLQDNISVFLF